MNLQVLPTFSFEHCREITTKLVNYSNVQNHNDALLCLTVPDLTFLLPGQNIKRRTYIF